MATNRRGLLGLLTGGLLGFLLHREASSPAGAQSAGPGDDPAIGTWHLSFQRPTGAPGSGLVTLAPGGIFLRSGDTHPTESPGHGVWVRTGDREVTFTSSSPARGHCILRNCRTNGLVPDEVHRRGQEARLGRD